MAAVSRPWGGVVSAVIAKLAARKVSATGIGAGWVEIRLAA